MSGTACQFQHLPLLDCIVCTSLHVECFMSIVVGVGDNQTMDEVCHVFISFNVALCAYVPVCLDVQSVCLCLQALPFLSVVC